MIQRTRQCRVPTVINVGTRHCRVLAVSNINSDANEVYMKHLGEKAGRKPEILYPNVSPSPALRLFACRRFRKLALYLNF
jgi:hypothetical protein